MELKVWVEGIQRIICGVTEYTTCQDIVYALAHATGQTGRFTLIERWRNNERLLAPTENPLKILVKWGEYSNDVQFVLQRTFIPPSSGSENSSVLFELQSPAGSPSPAKLNTVSVTKEGGVADGAGGVSEAGRNLRKSLTISAGAGYLNHRVGVVRGVPQQATQTQGKPAASQAPPPYREPPRPKSPPAVPAPAVQQPPPYRAPPSPVSPASGGRQSREDLALEEPQPAQIPAAEPLNTAKPAKKNIFYEEGTDSVECATVVVSAQYKELLRLINQQRDKLGSLQADLTKHDAEITFWESQAREQHHKTEYMVQEGLRLQETSRLLDDQLVALKNIEEEKEISKQQSKTLKSEITLLRSKLANCETELLQCKIKIRRLLEELELEQRALSRLEEEPPHQQQLPDSSEQLLAQLTQLHRQLESAKVAGSCDQATAQELDQQVAALETLIQDKKQQMERLVSDMKEANLRSLLISPATDEGLRSHLLEGCLKPGVSRRMIGSPRQLENAAPTSKNPHGVWV